MHTNSSGGAERVLLAFPENPQSTSIRRRVSWNCSPKKSRGARLIPVGYVGIATRMFLRPGRVCK
jgi:hypothetical protein